VERARTARTAILVAALTIAGCASPEQQLRQHQKALDSLAASASAIAEAWLAGSASGTYARTAFERTFELIEAERTALAARPDTVADVRIEALMKDAEAQSRIVSGLA
jgi:hypothetical protein